MSTIRSKRFDVLFGSTEPPDPFGNAAGRWYFVLAKGLSARGHRVRWLSSFRDEISAERARAALSGTDVLLKVYPYQRRHWLKQKALTIRRPYSYFVSDDFRRDMEAEQRRGYDVLHLEQTSAGWLGLDATRSVLSIHWIARVDLEGAQHPSIRSRVTTHLLASAERRLIRRFQHLRVLTPQDAAVVKSINPAADISVGPLGIDTQLYQYQTESPGQPLVGLIGSMGWNPNFEAARRLLTRIWPLVKASVPDAHLLIAGWDASRLNEEARGAKDVTILENVPSAEECFRRLSVMAFPVARSSGMKVKVLEAMAYGVPVVTTAEGLAGVQARDDREVCVEQDDEEFARRVTMLLQSRTLRNRIRRAARDLVDRCYSPEPTLRDVESVYARLCES